MNTDRGSRIADRGRGRAPVAFLMLPVLLLSACRPFAPRSTDPVAQEQEIVRDVKWRLSKDTRFDDVLVSCAGRVVTLAGRVSNAQSAKDAQAIAAAVRDVERVDNRIDVKAK